MNMKLKFMCCLMVLSVTPVVLADYVITGRDSGTVTRLNDSFQQIWQTTGQSSSQQVEISPVTGDVYVGFAGDVVKRFNRLTGANISPNSGAPYQAKHDLEWGYDFNGDGIQDIWTVKNDTTMGYIQVTSGADMAQNLASFAAAHTNSTTLDGTGGRGCCFGPDLNGDGVNDFYTVIGWNDANCRINVWNPVALKTASNSTEILAARIASYSASTLREPIDLILGPDFNDDGLRDLWVSSHYGNNLVIYDYTDGTQLGTSTLGGLLSSSRQPRSIDIANGPNGTVLVTTRFATSLDPEYVAGSETKKGNLLQYNHKTGEVTLLYGSMAIGRIDSVTYFPDGIYAPDPSNNDRVATTQATLGWSLPDPNFAGSTIYCDVYFAQSYPDYSLYPDPNIADADPNTWYVENSNFLDYATKVVDNQPGMTSLDLSTVTTVPLTYGQDYFWRVDVRDSSDVEAGTIVGTVLKFTADNTAPAVNAGADIVTWLTEGVVNVTMAPTVSDDGKPVNPGYYTVSWTETPEDPNCVINTPTVEATSVTIDATGTYTLRLTADDGELTGFDTVIINVYADACAAAKAQAGYTALQGDIDNDCDVDLDDFMLMAGNWLDSTAL
jgi:hypothetical protein